MTASVLFCDPKGSYAGLGLDLWDIERDARLYDGPGPVVAHPPCSKWCQMAKANQKRYGTERNLVGDDGGCFKSALACVLRFGGVLEHPAYSLAWEEFGLLGPRRGRWELSSLGYWVTEVSQVAYGHTSRKRTWLLYNSKTATRPFALDWSEPPHTTTCGHDAKSATKPALSKKKAIQTPPAFRDLLLRLAARSVETPF